MFSIFTSPKKLVVESPGDPQAVLATFHKRVQAANTMSAKLVAALSPPGKVFGVADGRNVQLSYIWLGRSGLQPVMHVHIEATAAGGSVLLTRFSTALWMRLLLSSLTLAGIPLFANAMLAPPSCDPTPFIIASLFPPLGLMLIGLMRIFAQHEETQLERFVREVAAES